MCAMLEKQPLASFVFWGEMAPCDHFVQIYEREDTFLDTLEGFVSGGLLARDSAIVIATPEHRAALAARLHARGIDVAAMIAAERYIVLDAEETLSRFMVGQWPDDDLFGEVVTELLDRARRRGHRVRAFGEMVAVLWAQGNNGATVRLEHLWHELVRRNGDFTLFCAYPRAGFTRDAAASMQHICETHSRVVEG